jgi:hypothetical protein
VVPLVFLASALVSLPLTSAAQRTDRLTRAFLLPKATPLVLRATVGEIAVTGWDRPDVSVEIERRSASLGDLAAMPALVEVGKSGARVTVLQAGGEHDASLRGSITVRAPFDQLFGEIALFEGRISLERLRGGVRARVEHGSIDAESLAGDIRLETTIGNVRLDRAEASGHGMIRLRTFNGDIALGFATMPAHARILALALDGTIRSDVPLTLKTGFGPRFGETTLGRGAPVVSIDAVRGDIRITRGKA